MQFPFIPEVSHVFSLDLTPLRLCCFWNFRIPWIPVPWNPRWKGPKIDARNDGGNGTIKCQLGLNYCRMFMGFKWPIGSSSNFTMFSSSPAPKEAKKSSQLGLSSNFLDPFFLVQPVKTHGRCAEKNSIRRFSLVSAPSFPAVRQRNNGGASDVEQGRHGRGLNL